MERHTTVISQPELDRQAAICREIASYWKAEGRTPLAFVDTYGCQQNEADSERIRGMLLECGYRMSDTEEGADCIVINTCAIREHAETRVYGNVGALVHTKNRHPAQKIFLCGCMMGQPTVVEKIKHSYHHVDGVFNPHQLWRFPELLQQVLGFAYTAPVEGQLSSGFGLRTDPLEGVSRFHYGLDIAAPEGAVVSSFADGTVTAVGESSELGRYVAVSHANGFSTLYAHCTRVTASAGQQVSRGDPIAEVGDTGRATGPHLHFELHRGSTYLNPVYYVTFS